MTDGEVAERPLGKHLALYTGEAERGLLRRPGESDCGSYPGRFAFALTNGPVYAGEPRKGLQSNTYYYVILCDALMRLQKKQHFRRHPLLTQTGSNLMVRGLLNGWWEPLRGETRGL